ncbi:MAG: hypothetical protein HY396_00250 [Candidatus Doudnabacteria bacterium]|nr:hypothetical protein [Candidatus Doudnabacteria bacterium]
MLRIIHPNRWFFWTIVILLTAAFLLLYASVETIKSLDELTAGLTGSLVRLWKTFASQALGISLRYPASWQIEIDPAEPFSVSLQNPADYGENVYIAVTDPKYESTIRKALDVVLDEEEISLDGYQGAWLKSGDAKDVALSNILLVKVDGRLYYIAGQAKTFEKIIKSIKFLE